MQVELFRELIEERIAELEQLLARAAAHSSTLELDQSRVGRLSRMDAMQAQAMDAETKRRRLAQLSRLRAALGRIDAGDYGECRECGEAIPERRLRNDPGAVLCIECASGTG